MTIDREIISDLLPLYRAGLASEPSRRLVEAWLADHPDEQALRGAPAAPADADGLAALTKARRLRRRLRHLYGLALALTVLSLTSEFHFASGRLESARLVAFDHPLAFAPVVLGAMAAWGFYLGLRRRLR